jgi:hypothetical protein
MYATDDDILDDNTNTIKKNIEALLVASRDVGLEVNTEENKYIVMSCHQNHYLIIANKSFENVVKFKYLGTTVTDQDCNHEENKSRFNFGNVFYHSVQSL